MGMEAIVSDSVENVFEWKRWWGTGYGYGALLAFDVIYDDCGSCIIFMHSTLNGWIWPIWGWAAFTWVSLKERNAHFILLCIWILWLWMRCRIERALNANIYGNNDHRELAEHTERERHRIDISENFIWRAMSVCVCVLVSVWMRNYMEFMDCTASLLWAKHYYFDNFSSYRDVWRKTWLICN